MGNNINKSNPKQSFAGAFVADPKLVSDKPKVKINGKAINILRNNDDFDFTALYPSIIEQSNMSPATMHGKVLFDQPTDKLENRFDNPYYDRSVWFIEDLNSGDYLNFCQRYLNLASYEEMFDDIEEYFTTIKYPIGSLRSFDTISGKRIMINIVPKNQKRDMITLIDKSKDDGKRDMVRLIERMPDINVSFNNKNSGAASS